jgi:hypothetical protein
MEIEAVENYIFSVNAPTFAEIRQKASPSSSSPMNTDPQLTLAHNCRPTSSSLEQESRASERAMLPTIRSIAATSVKPPKTVCIQRMSLSLRRIPGR